MTIREIISRIREEVYDKGVPSDDSRLRNRLVYSKMRTIRNDLLVKKSNKNQLLSPDNYQTVTLPLVLSTTQIPELKSELYESPTLPNILFNMDEPLIKTVQNLDSNNPLYISATTYEKSRYITSSKITGKNKKYYWHNNKLYFINVDCNLKEVDVTAIFEDVIFDKDSCVSYLDYRFPLQSELLETLIQMAQEALIKILVPLSQDLKNNAIDDRN